MSQLPKPELIEGEIDYTEMIKKDYRKATLIILLTILATGIVTVGLFLLFFFL